MSHHDWEAALAVLEADVEEAAAALAHGQLPPATVWDPPADLGPLPAHLEERAERLVAAIAEVQEATRVRLQALADELHELEQRRGAVIAYAAQGEAG